MAAKQKLAPKKSAKNTDPRDAGNAAREQTAINRTGPADQTPAPYDGFDPSSLDPLSKDFVVNDIPVVGGIYKGAQGIVNDALGNAEPAPGSITPEEWRAQRERMMARYDAAGNRIDQTYVDAEQDRAAARAWGGTDPIRQVAPITGKDLAYHDVHAPTSGLAYDPGPVERGMATHVGATRDVGVGPIGAAERVSDTSIGPAALAGQTQVGRTAIDTSRADEIRGRETSNLDRLERAAAGLAPSAAEGTLKAGLAASGQQAMGLAASARGSERAGARRQAIQAIGEGGFKAAQSASALRASEMADARNALTGALTSSRAADTSVATDQAHLDAAAQSLQAQIDAARASGNAQEVNRLLSQQASLTASSKALNANAANQRVTDVTNMRLSADTSNADRALRAASQDAAADTATSATGTAAANARAEALAERRTATDQANLTRGVAVDTGNQDRQQASDTEAAREWIQQQQLNNEEGISRDQAEANRQRGDFTAQTGAAQGATGQAINAANLTLQQVQAMTNAELQSMAAQGSSAAQQEIARRQAQAAGIGTITKIGSAIATGGTSLAAPSGGESLPIVHEKF